MLSCDKTDRNVIHISSHSPFSWNRLSLFQEAYYFFFSLFFFSLDFSFLFSFAVFAVSISAVDRNSESDIIFYFFVHCHFSWFLFSVSGQLSTTVLTGAQGVTYFSLFVFKSLPLHKESVTSLASFLNSVSGQLSTIVSEGLWQELKEWHLFLS